MAYPNARILSLRISEKLWLLLLLLYLFILNGEQGIIALKKNPHKTLFKAESILAVRL